MKNFENMKERTADPDEIKFPNEIFFKTLTIIIIINISNLLTPHIHFTDS